MRRRTKFAKISQHFFYSSQMDTNEDKSFLANGKAKVSWKRLIKTFSNYLEK